MNHTFSGGVIDYKRLECRDFFTGKSWKEIDYKALAKNNFYPTCLTEAGYINFFPAILLAALCEKEGLAEQALFNRVIKIDPVVIKAIKLLNPDDCELFLDIIDLWGNEDESYFENNSLLKVLQFKEVIEN
jgi:hypothetical protein